MTANSSIDWKRPRVVASADFLVKLEAPSMTRFLRLACWPVALSDEDAAKVRPGDVLFVVEAAAREQDERVRARARVAYVRPSRGRTHAIVGIALLERVPLPEVAAATFAPSGSAATINCRCVLVTENGA